MSVGKNNLSSPGFVCRDICSSIGSRLDITHRFWVTLYWQFLPCFCPCFVFKIFLGQAFISFLTSRQNPLFNNIVSLGSAMSCIFSRQCLPKINKSFSKLCFWSTKSILSRNTTLTWCSIMNALYPSTCTFLHPWIFWRKLI